MAASNTGTEIAKGNLIFSIALAIYSLEIVYPTLSPARPKNFEKDLKIMTLSNSKAKSIWL